MNSFLNKLAETIKNLDIKVQYGVLFLILFFMFLLNYLLVVRLEISVIKEMNGTQLSVKNEILRLEGDTKRLNQLKAELTRHQQKLDDPQIKFRAKNEIPDLIAEMTKFAQTFDVRVDQLISVKEPEELLLTNAKGKYWAVPLLLQARGGYHSIGKWLNQLERERLLLNVKKISIAADEKNMMDQQIQAVLRVVVMEVMPAKEGP